MAGWKSNWNGSSQQPSIPLPTPPSPTRLPTQPQSTSHLQQLIQRIQQQIQQHLILAENDAIRHQFEELKGMELALKDMELRLKDIELKTLQTELTRSRREADAYKTLYEATQLPKMNGKENSAPVAVGDQSAKVISLTEDRQPQKPIQADNGIRWSLEDFDVGRPLGQGKFSTVFIAREKRNERIITLDVILKTQLVQLGVSSQLKKEIVTQYHLRHPNILTLYGYFHDDKRMYIIRDYASRGNLQKFLHKQGHKVSEIIAARFVRQLASALKFCHSKGVIHRDVKPKNLLLDADLNLKLAEFACSVVDSSKPAPRHALCGTIDYLAPEMVLNQSHDFNVDIWPIGILLFEILVGFVPFASQTGDKLSARMECKLHIPSTVSDGAARLINAIIKTKPSERLPLNDIMAHTWIKQMQENEEVEVKKFMHNIFKL